jgi:hypothetical protein
MKERESPFDLALPLGEGSIVIERYVYEQNSKNGVQWLVYKLDKQGDLRHLRACKTRKEALKVAGRA